MQHQRRAIRTLLSVFALCLGGSSVQAEDWLTWAGPRGDFTAQAGTLAESWPTERPKRLDRSTATTPRT